MNLEEIRELVVEDAEAQHAYERGLTASGRLAPGGEWTRLREHAEETRRELGRVLVEQAPWLLAQAEKGSRSELLAGRVEEALARAGRGGAWQLVREAVAGYRKVGGLKGRTKKAGVRTVEDGVGFESGPGA